MRVAHTAHRGRLGVVAGALTVAAAVALGSTAAQAAIEKAALCQDKKVKATGKNSLDLLKAFGKNGKRPNTVKLDTDISKAQSKITKLFTRAEFTRSGDSRECDTVGDVGAIESKVELFVQDVLDELTPSPSGAFVDAPSATLLE